MNKALKLNSEFGLYIKNEEVLCSSRQVAEIFDREHKNILKGIYDLVAESKVDDLAASFVATNFVEISYTNRGKEYPEFLLTRDGFSFLVMGYTGERARRFKIQYIDKFNRMAEYIQSLRTARLEYPDMTRAIQAAHEDPKSYHYSNEANMINKIVLGASAKEIRERFELKPGESIRPYLDSAQIAWIEKLQKRNTIYIEDGLEYEERKARLINYYARANQLALE